MTRSKRYRIGSYGAGALWCVSDDYSLSLFFNGLLIAKRGRIKREEKLWVSQNPEWTVTITGSSEILVQHNGSEGVFVSLHGGK
jgi:hypothetical protein